MDFLLDTSVTGAVLVHRDSHFENIPEELLSIETL